MKLLPRKMHIPPETMYSVLLQAVLKSLKFACGSITAPNSRPSTRWSLSPKLRDRYSLAISGSGGSFIINNVISMRKYALIKNS